MAANDARIEINRQEADYKPNKVLPVSLDVRTDDFFAIAKTGSTQLDNKGGRIVLPGTLNNQRIIEALQGASGYMEILPNGVPVFRGTCTHKETVHEGGMIKGYGLTLLGGARDLFSTLGDRTLRGLNLGTTLLTSTEVVNSWAGSYDTGWPVVWAPVMYGDTGDATGENGFDAQVMRPHVYFKTILDEVFNEMRVEVDSQLFGTDFFKRMVYLFGVGDRWGAGGSDAKEFRATQAGDITITNTTFDLLLPDDVNPPNMDPAGVWQGDFGTLDPGQWVFEIDMGATHDLQMFFTINNVYSQALPLGGGKIQIGPVEVLTNEDVRIEGYRTSTTSNGLIEQGVTLYGRRRGGATLGAEISVASCLHGERITKFLAGISHLFNLVWHYDTANRKLRVDPRFDFTVQGVNYPGFYRQPTVPTNWTGKMESKYTENPPRRPFGNWLILKNKAEGTKWHSDLADASDGQVGVPFMGARYDFEETGKNGKTQENPYFENLIACHGIGGPQNLSFMPAVMEDLEGEEVWPPQATYESGPKYGYYAGDVAGMQPWKWQGAARANRPLIYQTPPQFIPISSGIDVNVGWPTHHPQLSPITLQGITSPIKGLASIFYPRWLAILDRGKVLDIRGEMQAGDLEPSEALFSEFKAVNVGAAQKLWIFLGAKGFKPTQDGLTGLDFVEPVGTTELDAGKLKESTEVPYQTFT